MQPTSVVVLGGGVLGTATAAAAARLGARVTLVTAGQPGDGASGRSLAWLNAFGPYEPDYVRLRLEGLARYRALQGFPSVHFDGALTWGEDARSHYARLSAEGYPVRWLERAELPVVVPGVEVEAVPSDGALLTPEEGWVDLPALVAELASEVHRRSGRVLTDTGGGAPVVEGGQVVGAALADGTRLAADAVVVATGPAVPETLARLGTTVPDSTPTALLVRSAPAQTPLRAVVNAPRVSLRPTGDGGVAFDSGWSEQRVVRHPDGSWEVPAGTVEELVDEARAVVAGAPALPIDGVHVGPKPVPGDGRPVVGAVPSAPGCFVAFTHSGATLGLVLGDLLAAEVVAGERSPLLAAYRPERFGLDV
jgi:glycine/D-amino acid oxidase-like deaminating enzyme